MNSTSGPSVPQVPSPHYVTWVTWVGSCSEQIALVHGSYPVPFLIE